MLRCQTPETLPSIKPTTAAVIIHITPNIIIVEPILSITILNYTNRR